jgi:hypothetical protein
MPVRRNLMPERIGITQPRKQAHGNPGRKGDGKAARREKNNQIQEKVKQSGEHLNDKE